MRSFWSLLLFVWSLDALSQSTFYVDPGASPYGADGSEVNPFVSFQALLDSGKVAQHSFVKPYDATNPKVVGGSDRAEIQPGDRVVLLPGKHGDVSIDGFVNPTFIDVVGVPGAELSGLRLRGSSGWRFESLTITEPRPKQESNKATLIWIDNHNWVGPSSDIVIKNCFIGATADISAWSKEDWYDYAYNGILTRGTDVLIEGNQLVGVGMGIESSGKSTLIRSNVIRDFLDDGVRLNGSFSEFSGNIVMNPVIADDNHDDLFQSFSHGTFGAGSASVDSNRVLKNLFANFVDRDSPLYTESQGIGMFDGLYQNWTVSGNVVLVNHWHGISFMGLRNSLIEDNLVGDTHFDNVAPVDIEVFPHKNGALSYGNTLLQNVEHKLSPEEVLVLSRWADSLGDLSEIPSLVDVVKQKVAQ